MHSASAVPLGAVPSSLSPLHSASVHVTEFSPVSNPEPVGEGGCEGKRSRQGRDWFGEDYLSPMKLRELTGERDLHQVTYLEISVNSQTSSLGNFGSSLPFLGELRCVESVVPCVRDLGTSLTQLTVLWLPQCGLRDLDGLPSLSSLRELYISFNEVCDVSVTAMLPSLQVLDMESNQVSEEDQLGYLGLCCELSSLTLAGNPLAQHIALQQGGEDGYRLAILKALPYLKVLDDIPVTDPSPLLHTGRLLSQSVEFSRVEAGRSAVTDQSFDRSESITLNEVCSAARPRTAISPGSAGCVSPTEDDSSDLTHGLSQVMCGNPVRALKARRRRGLHSQSSVIATAPSLSSSSAHPVTLDVLMEELSVTRTTSVEDLTLSSLHPASMSVISHQVPRQPGPPSSSLQPVHRKLPTPPPSTPPARPHSVADFRQRRYRRPQPVTRSLSEHVSPSWNSSLPPTSTLSHKSLHTHTPSQSS